MSKNTDTDPRAALRAKHAEEKKQLDRKLDILEQLPPGIKPSVANIAKQGASRICGFATLSFSRPAHDPGNKYDLPGILAAIDGAGWTLGEACRVKYGNWRSRMAYGTPDEQPDEDGRDAIEYARAAFPVWLKVCPYTGAELCAWIVSPKGRQYRASFDLPKKLDGMLRVEGLYTASHGTQWTDARRDLRFFDGRLVHPHGLETLGDVAKRAQTLAGCSGGTILDARICWEWLTLIENPTLSESAALILDAFDA